jgi:hypothetical protein
MVQLKRHNMITYLDQFFSYYLRKTYIPKTLTEAIMELDRIISKKEKKQLLEAVDKKNAALAMHHTLGRHIRNKWQLWNDSELAINLKTVYGIDHPDSMSHAIIMTYCNNLVK